MGYIVVGVNSFPPTRFSKNENFKTVSTQSHFVPNTLHRWEKEIMRGGSQKRHGNYPITGFSKIDDVIAAWTVRMKIWKKYWRCRWLVASNWRSVATIAMTLDKIFAFQIFSSTPKISQSAHYKFPKNFLGGRVHMQCNDRRKFEWDLMTRFWDNSTFIFCRSAHRWKFSRER